MFTGRDALSSVEQAISRVRADESRLDAALRSAIDEAARLRRQEADGFRLLAQVRLDAMVRDRIIEDLDATERRALAMIENQTQALEGLTRRRDEAQAALDKAEAAQHDRDQDLARAIEALEELRLRTAARIKSDPDWQAAKAAVGTAETIAANADKKASLAEADLAAKRKPYEDDPLFMYLWSKKHGQAEDGSGNFVRFFDRKIARLIGYQEARPDYAMLQEIPTRLREHAKSKQEDVEAAKDRLGEIERRALVAGGAEPLETDTEARRTAATAAETAVAKLTAELQQIEADRQKALGGGEEAAYGGAVEILVQGLAREDLRQLYQDAARTKTDADDRAIASISTAREALQKADGEVSQIRIEIREMARRRTELEGARDRARSQGYDNPMGDFGSQTVIGEVIAGILRGALRGGDLDRVFRDNYRRPRPRVDIDFGGLGRGSRSRGGGFGGGGFGGGARRGGGGGGWRTGGNF
jgi:hypothetical protein